MAETVTPHKFGALFVFFLFGDNFRHERRSFFFVFSSDILSTGVGYLCRRLPLDIQLQNYNVPENDHIQFYDITHDTTVTRE